MSKARREDRIPVVVGATGHRNIREADKSVLKDAVRRELNALCQKYPCSPFVLMTCLAEGADMLCAEVALELGMELIAVLPMPKDEYEKDFEGAALLNFQRLCAESSELFVSAVTEKYDGRFGDERDWHYRQAGLYIANHSHILLALWDGQEGDDVGCGTSSIVNAMLNDAFGDSGKRQLHPGNGVVIQVVAMRAAADSEEEAADQNVGEVKRHGAYDELEKNLIKTELFNKDVGKRTSGSRADLQKENDCKAGNGSNDRILHKLYALYEAADSISTENAGKHRKFLAGMSVAATALTLIFLLYDEMEFHGLIIICGFIIFSLFIINTISRHSRSQQKYLDYRVLAENLRVQTHLYEAGAACEVSEIMPWNLQLALPWVKNAIDVTMIGETVIRSDNVRESWIIGQRDYHKRAYIKTARKLKSNDRIVRTALILTIAFYAAALIFELVWGGLLGIQMPLSADFCNVIRLWIKIVLGTLSATTLFANNYYGKQALPNVMDDHIRMEILYEVALREMERLGEKEELFIRLAENELAETANWYAYQSKNEPELGI